MLQVATAAFALLMAASPSAGSAYLKEARALYDSQDYEACLSRVEQARKAAPVGEEAQVEFVGALCSSQLGKFAEAESIFRLARRLDQTLTLPGDVSPKVRGAFEKARAAIEKELADANPTKTPVSIEPANPPIEPPPAVVVKAPEAPSAPLSTPAWIAIGSGSATAASGTVAIIFGVMASSSAAAAASASNDVAFGQAAARARGQQTAANVAWGLTAAFAVATAVATGATLW